MKRIYGESGQYSIAEENELFGIVDNSGHLLLPLEYERITVAYGIKDGFGFIVDHERVFGQVLVKQCVLDVRKYGFVASASTLDRCRERAYDALCSCFFIGRKIARNVAQNGFEHGGAVFGVKHTLGRRKQGNGLLLANREHTL